MDRPGRLGAGAAAGARGVLERRHDDEAGSAAVGERDGASGVDPVAFVSAFLLLAKK